MFSEAETHCKKREGLWGGADAWLGEGLMRGEGRGSTGADREGLAAPLLCNETWEQSLQTPPFCIENPPFKMLHNDI